MDENMKKINDEHLNQIAGGANSSTPAPKFKFKDHVRSISRPDLGLGMIGHTGLSNGINVYEVYFKDEDFTLTLPEDDLMLAE